MSTPIPLIYLDFSTRQYLVDGKLTPENEVVGQLFSAPGSTFNADGIFAPIGASMGGGGVGPWSGTNSPCLLGRARDVAIGVTAGHANMCFIEFVAIPFSTTEFNNQGLLFFAYQGGATPGTDCLAYRSTVSIYGPDEIQEIIVSSASNTTLLQNATGLDTPLTMSIMTFNFAYDGPSDTSSSNVSINGSALSTASGPGNAFLEGAANEFALVNNGRDPTQAGQEGITWGTGAIRRIAVYSLTDFPPPTFPSGSSPGGFPPPPRQFGNTTPGIMPAPQAVPLPCVPCCSTAAPLCECA